MSEQEIEERTIIVRSCLECPNIDATLENPHRPEFVCLKEPLRESQMQRTRLYPNKEVRIPIPSFCPLIKAKKIKETWKDPYWRQEDKNRYVEP